MKKPVTGPAKDWRRLERGAAALLPNSQPAGRRRARFSLEKRRPGESVSSVPAAAGGAISRDGEIVANSPHRGFRGAVGREGKCKVGLRALRQAQDRPCETPHPLQEVGFLPSASSGQAQDMQGWDLEAVLLRSQLGRARPRGRPRWLGRNSGKFFSSEPASDPRLRKLISRRARVKIGKFRPFPAAGSSP